MSELATRDLTWARKITERLRLQATNFAEAREKVLATLHDAQEGGAAELLGYASWTAYVSDVFGDAPLRLEREQRQELVAELAAQGMSTRAIAPIVGVTPMQVSRDVQAGVTNVTPDPQVVIHVNADPGEVVDEPRVVTGLDGKQYTQPETRKPNRRALGESADAAGWELRKSVERIERIREDDRFSRNKEEVAARLRGHLMYAIESCQGLLDELNQSRED